MNSFVKIEALYTESDRSVSSLRRIYKDHDLLLTKIASLFSNTLTEKEIAGKKVLLKPNWVRHSANDLDELCMRTHNNFLLAVLDTILQLKPSSVLIGDAPIQGCHWDKVVNDNLSEQIDSLSTVHGIPVRIKDFRRVTFEPSKNNPLQERNPMSDYLLFDIGKESFLEDITSNGKNKFRVTNYNPDRMTAAHRKGVHVYCITRELFEADVVISIPKVKTHQKTGITAALKNIVGLNGDKDYLPHHRLGGTGLGGDCYPGKNYLRYWSELCLDFANRRQGKAAYWLGYKASRVLWKLSLPGRKHHISAGWHGNDTTWRMVLDLNKIIIYGKRDGSLSREPQRQLYSLSDGIIGGQGDGPLKPEPSALGIIAFTNNAGMNDLAMAIVMGFDPMMIPLLKSVYSESEINETRFFWNNKESSLTELKGNAINIQPPPGWNSYLK